MEGAQTVVQWLNKGVVDAIEKGYLRKIKLEILDSKGPGANFGLQLFEVAILIIATTSDEPNIAIKPGRISDAYYWRH